MRWPLPFLTLALAAGTSLAQGADPLKSPECVRALEALRTQEATMPATPRRQGAGDDSQALAAHEARRRRAAHDCLSSRLDEPPQVVRSPTPPISVAPVAPVALPSAAVVPVPGAVPPPIQNPPLQTVTSHDPSGCWTSDGRRLGRMGSILVGPGGPCTVNSTVLSCR